MARLPSVDLTPFGFTPTEGLAYGTLLSLGPSSGYAVAAWCRIARANAYAALEGLVRRGAARRDSGRPARYRPVGPDALLARLAADQAAALDRLDLALKGGLASPANVLEPVAGRRPLAAVVLRLAGRAATSVRAALPAWLIAETVPAWRRAAASLDHQLWVVEPLPSEGWTAPVPVAGTVDPSAWAEAWPGAPILLAADGQHALSAIDPASPTGEGATGWWGNHPALVSVVMVSLGRLTAR